MSDKDHSEQRLSRQQIGAIGEQEACVRLMNAGFSIITRNWRCRTGELDIIAAQQERLVFIEVRTRSRKGRFGTGAESVDSRKQRQVRETAQVYLRMAGKLDCAVRFDVIEVELDGAGIVQHYRHLEAAF